MFCIATPISRWAPCSYSLCLSTYRISSLVLYSHLKAILDRQEEMLAVHSIQFCFRCIASAPSPMLLSRTLVWRWSTRRSLVTWSSLFFSILTCFAQIALYVFGRGTGIYRRDGNGTGTVPDQHTVPPCSWMRTDILFLLLQNISLLQNNWSSSKWYRFG